VLPYTGEWKNMGFKQFSLLIAVRTILIMLNLLALTYLLFIPGYHAATLALVLLLIWQCFSIVKFIARTNAELVRFLEAARHADYSQRFDLSELGSGFGELGETFSDILQRFQLNRQQQEEKLRHLKAVVEHVPVPLISIKQEGQITLWNNASRRLFGSGRIVRIEDFEQFGDDFAHHLISMKAGEKRLVAFQADDMTHQLSVSATDVIVAAEQEKLISLQDIQNELDASQMQAWQDLVKVLTHEIMNSITPVASLAKTAVDLVADTKQQAGDQPELQTQLDDIASAVTTVARRSEGLTKFVGSYRKLTSLPPPNKTSLQIIEVFKQVMDIAKQDTQSTQVNFTYHVEPSTLRMDADRTMLEQILINLLKNAQQATQNLAHPVITLNAELNRRGHVVIDIADNGHGIDDETQTKIFIPFFTTKKQGSGVGLALTRQVMNAHGGTVKVTTSKAGGALFSLVF
jgi:nitrogen fixation/metabolism regulation signal transduction histidine kinase